MPARPLGTAAELLTSLPIYAHADGAPRPAIAGGASPSAAKAPPRPVTRGETGSRICVIDWLSFSVKLKTAITASSLHAWLIEAIGDPQLSMALRDRGMYGYKRSAALGIPSGGESAHGGTIAWDGSSQAGTIFVSLPGTFCARVLDWVKVAEQLDSWEATITRVDLAHDDLAGTRSIEDVVVLYEQGVFNRGGRQPKASVAGDWINHRGEGRTLYIGRRGNGKFLRVYEKGKQQGDANSPWLRYEVELLKKDRYIPADVLTDPDRYLAGCYPAFEFLSLQPARIKTQRRIAKASLDRLTEIASLASGKTINALRTQGHSPDKIMSLLMRPGLPKRLIGPVASMPPNTQYAVGGHGDT